MRHAVVMTVPVKDMSNFESGFVPGVHDRASPGRLQMIGRADVLGVQIQWTYDLREVLLAYMEVDRSGPDRGVA